MNLRTPILALSLSVMSLAASADHLPDLYVIPVAAHTNGNYGTFWKSDVTVHNFSARLPLNFELLFVSSGEGIGDNVRLIATSTLQPQQTVTLRDVLDLPTIASPTIVARSGAIIVKGDRQFAVTSRTYVETPEGGSYGQSVKPFAEFLDAMKGDSDPTIAYAFLPGLVANSKFRTNLGFVAGVPESATEPLTIQFAIVRSDGSSYGARNFTILPGAINHVQFSAREIVGDHQYDAATAYVRIVSGDGAVVPYASIVDNTTGDASFVETELPPNQGAMKNAVFKELLDEQ